MLKAQENLAVDIPTIREYPILGY